MKRWSLVLSCLLVGGLAGSFVAAPLLKGDPKAIPAIPKELTSYRDIVKTVLPAVVSIQTRVKPVAMKTSKPKNEKARPRVELPPGIPDEFRKFFKDFDMPKDFEWHGDTPHAGFGSGFIVDPKGVILTNHHVVNGADQVEIQLKDGRKFVSKEIKSDPKTDLAVVKIETKKELPWLEMGDSDAMEIGDRVLAVGAPFGLTGTVTHGIVSAKGRHLNMSMYEDYLQTDAPINPGNSGGPLISLEGKVIGINTAIKSQNGGFQGVGLAIPSTMAKNIMDQLLKDGVVRRGYLGVQVKNLEPEVAEKLGVEKGVGVVVAQVFDKTPAAKAGLQAGDIVTSLGGKPVKASVDVQAMVARLPLNQPVEVAVLRDGKAMTLKVTIEEQPKDYGTARLTAPAEPKEDKDAVAMDKLGMELADLTPEWAGKFGFKDGQKGVVITKVESDGLAYESGLRAGTLITKVDSKKVENAEAARKALEKATAKGALLQVQTAQGGTDYVVIKATETAQK